EQPTGVSSSRNARTVTPEKPADGIAGDVAGDARVLLQPAQRVRVPLAAERHVDTQLVPLRDELVAARRPHAQQHLELVFVAREAALGHEPPPLAEQPLVMRGDADVAPGSGQRL